MEVSMSKTRRGKYTDNRICYISKCKGDMRRYLRRKGKLPCFSYLVRGKSFSFYRGKVGKKSQYLLVHFGSILLVLPILDRFLLQIYKKIIKESHKPIKKATNGLFFTICSYFLFI